MNDAARSHLPRGTSARRQGASSRTRSRHQQRRGRFRRGLGARQRHIETGVKNLICTDEEDAEERERPANPDESATVSESHFRNAGQHHHWNHAGDKSEGKANDAEETTRPPHSNQAQRSCHGSKPTLLLSSENGEGKVQGETPYRAADHQHEGHPRRAHSTNGDEQLVTEPKNRSKHHNRLAFVPRQTNRVLERQRIALNGSEGRQSERHQKPDGHQAREKRARIRRYGWPPAQGVLQHRFRLWTRRWSEPRVQRLNSGQRRTEPPQSAIRPSSADAFAYQVTRFGAGEFHGEAL